MKNANKPACTINAEGLQSLRHERFTEYRTPKHPHVRFFSNDKDTVVAVTTYRGKRVRDKAVCNPDDKFILERGIDIAATRVWGKVLNLKIKDNDRRIAVYNETIDELLADRQKFLSKSQRLDEEFAEYFKVLTFMQNEFGV